MTEHQKDIKEIKGEVEKLRGDLKNLMNTLAGISRDEVSGAKAAAEGELQSLMQQVNRRYRELREQSTDIAGKAREQMEERPVASMLVALAAGALLGGIVSRK